MFVQIGAGQIFLNRRFPLCVEQSVLIQGDEDRAQSLLLWDVYKYDCIVGLDYCKC